MNEVGKLFVLKNGKITPNINSRISGSVPENEKLNLNRSYLLLIIRERGTDYELATIPNVEEFSKEEIDKYAFLSLSEGVYYTFLSESMEWHKVLDLFPECWDYSWVSIQEYYNGKPDALENWYRLSDLDVKLLYKYKKEILEII